MLFNSFSFAIFLPVVFILYWFVFRSNLKFQNMFVLAASYLFYGWWDYRFLSLLIISTLIDYSVGIGLEKYQKIFQRKLLLLFSLTANLGMLGFFKYWNFFIDSWIDFMSTFGIHTNISSINIILPVGISFYTFQTLSYSIDVYRGKIKPTKDFIAFASYVTFFPQLVAGPIERAAHLLPQFHKPRVFNYALAADGSKQILWGLVKKMVIADNCATYVDQVFNNYTTMPLGSLFLGVLFFAFQIYCDFSGYSDIAIGCARLFGFDLMDNFRYPYFSRDIAEFWRRWHISLSTWFRDYVYIPLGGSRVNLNRQIFNIMVIFVVSGFWHGANWTFIFWGFLNALYFIPLAVWGKNRINLNIAAAGKFLPSFKEFIQILSTFFLTCVAWVFFRAPSISSAFLYFQSFFNKRLLGLHSRNNMLLLLLIIILFTAFEWYKRGERHPLVNLSVNRPLRWAFYSILCIAILMNIENQDTFIYFQF